MGHPEKARRGIGPETKEELIGIIITAWEGIEISLANKLVDSMPK
jgi:hypothetical protein